MHQLVALRVMVVEDEIFFAMLIKDYLCGIGHEVVGPITRVEAGVQASKSLDIDFGVLDIIWPGCSRFPSPACFVRVA